MEKSDHDSSSLPWSRDELRRKMATLEQEIPAYRHAPDLLRQTENACWRFVPRGFFLVAFAS